MHPPPAGILARLVAVLCFPMCASAQVIISEFMASNETTTIVDEQGNREDWLELQNNGASAVSLNGWYLTDDATDLQKWRFPLTSPLVSLAAGGRLRVWCSGNDRKTAAAQLHTNFKLSASGEYLGLVAADGLTVVHDYAAYTQPDGRLTYPPQAPNVSYGVSGGRVWNALVAPSLTSDWKIRVPMESNDYTSVFAGWKDNISFADSTWTTKRTSVVNGFAKGIGYDSGGTNGARAFLVNYTGSPSGVITTAADIGFTAGMYNNNTGADAVTGVPTLCMRTTFNVADKSVIQALRLNVRYDDGFILYLNGTKVLEQNAPSTVTWNAAAPTNRSDSLSVTVDTYSVATTALVNGTNLLAIHAFNDSKNSPHFVVAPELQSQVGGNWSTLLGPTASAQLNWKVKMPFNATEFTRMNTWNTSQGFNDAGWVSRGTRLVGGLVQGIGYDTGGSGGTYGSVISYGGSPTGEVATGVQVGVTHGMYNNGTGTDSFPGVPTICARTNFTVADKTTIQQLRLNIRYDDGFIAWLNGVEVARANAPATPAWNSAAASDREDDQCETFETFSLAGAQNYLVNGSNFLAIQGFNSAKNAAQFILTPSLEGFQTVSGATGGAVGYLVNPTPGQENSIASATIGPIVTETTKNPTQPAASQNVAFNITAKVQPALNPISAVELRYVRMFDQAYGSENALTMFDNGTSGGDLVAGDGIYTALIPGAFMATVGESQMLRWRVIATDSVGNITKDPPYSDPLDSDQYFGTMAQTPSIQTQLPVLTWFQNSSSATAVFGTTEAGIRSSFFYRAPSETAGRFYDNVAVNLHGQSTAGFAKKSQNIGMNKDNRFKWRVGEEEINGFNLLSNWADKSHIRNALAWDVWNITKHPSHWSQHVRVQQVRSTSTAGQGNASAGTAAQFLGIWDMVEDGNSKFLSRWGLDPDGALYKVYNSLDNVSQNSSANGGGVEKKTREFENFSDLQALQTAMNTTNTVSARRQWLYDNVDVPALLNYLAVHALILNNDFGHKNYYIYRDTLKSGEWTLIPWDQDLSFGHTWTSGGGGYFDDDIDSGRGIFIGAASGNRLMNIITGSGATELAQMFTRRMRTLADQFYGPVAAPVNFLPQKIDSYLNLLDPPSWPVTTDAELDFTKWGFWVDGSGSVLASTHASAADHRIRPSAARIKDTNNTVLTGGIYPGANPYAQYGPAVDVNTSALPFVTGRRTYLYSGSPVVNGQSIPSAQPTNPSLVIESVNFNPGSVGQTQEFFIIRNPNAFAVDLSGWKVSGEVDHIFRAGTVIPAQGVATSDGTSSSYINQLIVAKDAKAFRSRTASPKAAEYRQVSGGYNGQLSARGGAIVLSRPDDLMNLDTTTYTPVATLNYTGTPTPAQLNLRITELNYNPANPTVAELAVLPNATSSDFEFIELMNVGATTLSLGGAKFEKGIEFVFPTPYNLTAGARCLVVANAAAFRLRYGNGLDSLMAGEWLGNLANGGEKIQLTDSNGEVVLEFDYSDAWFPASDGGGRTLVIKQPATGHDEYELPQSWRLSAVGGSPGGADAVLFTTYEAWTLDEFTSEEVLAGTATQATVDVDGDGLSNLMEYAFGRNPKVADAAELTQSSVTEVNGSDYLTITFDRNKAASDVTWAVEECGDLNGWQSSSVQVGAPMDVGNGKEQLIYRDTVPMSAERRFMRVWLSK